MSKRNIFWIVLLWQAIVYALVIGGIFVEIFELLGIPWNSLGWRNIAGTSIGWVLLELPALVLIAWFCVLRNKKGLQSSPLQDRVNSTRLP
jgi:hypothetical protein